MAWRGRSIEGLRAVAGARLLRIHNLPARQEILITKHNKPVAVLGPYRSRGMTTERKTAIRHAVQLMKKGLPGEMRCHGSPATKCMIGNDQFRHSCTRR